MLKIEIQSRLPPAIAIALSETSDWSRSERAVNEFLKELRSHAAAPHDYSAALRNSNEGPVVMPGGALTPFSEEGICCERKCRVHTARQMGRSLGILADVILIPDPLTQKLRANPRTPRLRNSLLGDIACLRELTPLIEAGVVQFCDTANICNSCTDQGIGEFRTRLIQDLHLDAWRVLLESDGSYLSIEHRTLHGNELNARVKLTQNVRRSIAAGTFSEKYLTEYVSNELRAAFRGLTCSSMEGAAFWSTSSVLTRTAAAMTSQSASARLNAAEAASTLELPWVRDLPLSAIVDLREEAKDALPALRTRVKAELTGALPEESEQRMKVVMAELRDEAARTASELKAIGKRRRNLAGPALATLGVASWPFLGTELAIGMVTIASFIQSMHRPEEHDMQLRPRSAAFALVKAQELLGHAR